MDGTVREQTRTKRTEAEAQPHQNLDLVQGLDAIVWEADATTFQFTFISERVEALLGYPVERWLSELRFWADHILPEDREWAVNYCALCTRALENHELEYRIRAADGRIVWLRDLVHVVADAQEQPVRLRGVMIDITERKRTEAMLAGQNQVLEQVVAGAPLGDTLTGLVRLIEAHAGGELTASILLLDADGVHLRHGAAPNLPESYNRAIDGLAIGPSQGSCGTAAFRGEPVVVTDIATDPLWADFRGLALPHGLRACWSTPILGSDRRVLGTFAIYHRTAHAPTEEQRQLIDLVTRTAALAIDHARAMIERRQNEHLRAVRYALTQALASAGTVQEARLGVLQAVCETLGWQVGEFWSVDRETDILRLVEAWSAPTVELAEFIALSRVTFERGVGLLGRVWASGEPLWPPGVGPEFARAALAVQAGLHAGFAIPIRLGHEVLGVMVFIATMRQTPDEALLELLTAAGSHVGQFIERKRAEEERAALLVREQAARAEAEAAVRTRDAFLAIITHDLKNPLTSIKGRAQFMRRRLGLDPERTRDADALATIEAQADIMRRQLDLLLDVSRLQMGHELALRLSDVDLGALVERLVEQHRATSDQYTSVLQQGAGEPLVGEWDADRLEQVIANLLSNAVKYSPAGGQVTVTLERQTMSDRNWACLTVRDEGVGIPAGDLPYVFEPFRRGSNVAAQIPGTGIGLTSSRQTVEQHGGSIVVQSREGHGTTFTIRAATRPRRGLTVSSSAACRPRSSRIRH